MVFQPSKQFYFSPEKTLDILPDDFDIEIDQSVSLHAWRFKSKGETKGVIVQFHGNAENISSHYLSVAWLLNHGWDVFTFDYRGYGKSTGISSFPHVITDSIVVLDFVKKLYPEQPVLVYGQSIGSLIAMQTIAHSTVQIEALITEGAIYSLNQTSANVLAKQWFTWPFQGFGYLLVSGKFNFKKIQGNFPKIPVLLLHSQLDPIIKPKQSKKLHKAIDDSNLELIEEPTHINIGNIEKGKYRPLILDFLAAM